MNPTDTAEAQAPGAALQLAEKVLTDAGYAIAAPGELHLIEFLHESGRVDVFWMSSDVRAQIHQDWVEGKGRGTYPAHLHDYATKRPGRPTIVSFIVRDVRRIT